MRWNWTVSLARQQYTARALSWTEYLVASRRLERMRANPRADWTISDVEAICREYGIMCEASRGGSSHYKVFHPGIPGALTVPFKRPIKPVYIRQLVIDQVRQLP